MAATARDSLSDLEAHRLRLEETIAQLRKSLHHWQVWDAEYETLKEEVEAISGPSPSQLEKIRDGFEADLVNAKEINDIFGPGMTRSKEQIVNVIDRRLDYVGTSIQGIQKNLEGAENRLAAVSVISQPDIENEEGLPITEIVEQLDDDDNVISYQLNRPGDGLNHVREALEKAGVKDLSPLDELEEKATPVAQSSTSATPSTKAQAKLPETATGQATEPPSLSKEIATAPKKVPKKAVSFSEDTKSEDAADQPKSRTAQRLEEIMKAAEEQYALSQQEPIVPDDESPEDAALRQEMLKYSMGEVGAVVAELDLEEGGSGDEDDEDYGSYSDEDLDEDDDDDEDQWGRSRTSVVTDSYRKRMLELEKKLGIKSRSSAQEEARLKNMEEGDDDSGSEDERVGRIRVNHGASANTSTSKPAPTKPSAAQPPPSKPIIKERQANRDSDNKGVRFAESLDIAPERDPTPPAQPTPKQEPVVEPMSDIIVERSTPSATTAPSADDSSRKASRFSRFKQSQSNIPKGPFDVPDRFIPQEEVESEGPRAPEGKTIADTLHERESTQRPKSDAEFAEFDDEPNYGEVADEYQRMRRKFVYRQGGFLKEEDNPAESLSEDGPPPMSRFKAARLSKQ